MSSWMPCPRPGCFEPRSSLRLPHPGFREQCSKTGLNDVHSWHERLSAEMTAKIEKARNERLISEYVGKE
ncbi:hypothetical protein FJV80_19590 [Mesorhizobium sp. WSM4310]|nr:hypothetical protein FJV80_19590 [Mesorhizobium sp. WSM4310]